MQGDCVSKISKLCTGTGHPIWNGMCSNCADDAILPEVIKQRLDREMNLEAERIRRQEEVKQVEGSSYN